GRLAHDLIKELAGDVVLEQPLAVLGEHRRIEARLHQAHIQEPAKQQLVVQLFTEGPLATHRVQRNEQRCLFSNRSGGMDGRPPAAYIASKTGDSSARARSANCLTTRNGWVRGTRSSRSTNASIVACGSRRPRIHATSLEDGSTLSGPPTQPEESNPIGVGVFPQPARVASGQLL